MYYFIHVARRQFPDKAIDLIDEACTSVNGKAKEAIVGPVLVAQVGALVTPSSTDFVAYKDVVKPFKYFSYTYNLI